MKKLIVLWIILSPLLLFAEPSFRIDLDPEDELSLLPRSSHTMALPVTNTGDTPLSLKVEPSLPSEWRTLPGFDIMELPPGESDFFLVSFLIPRQTLAGEYSVVFRVKEQAQGELQRESSVSVTVLAERKFSLRLLDKPDFVIAGHEYTLVFEWVNTGNIPLKTHWTFDEGNDFYFSYLIGREPGKSIFPPPEEGAPEPLPGEVRIVPLTAPGEVLYCQVKVDTEEGVNKILTHRMSIDVTVPSEAESDEKWAFRAKEVTHVEIIPQVSGKMELYHKMPLDLKYSTSHSGGVQYAGDLAVNAKTKGSLDEEGIHNIDAEVNKLIKFHDLQILYPGDTLSVEYFTPWYNAFLGDKGYNLSPLTENFGFGRGLSGAGYLPQMEYGGFYYVNVWQEPLFHHLGSYFKYYIPYKEDPAQALYLGQANLFSRPGDSLLFSLYNEYSPIKELRLTGEAAIGTDFTEPLQLAFLLKTKGDHQWIIYDTSLIYADPYFKGHYSDLFFLSGNLSFRLLGNRLKILGGAHQELRNLLFQEEKLSAPASRSFFGGTEYAWETADVAFLWRLNSREDLFPDKDYNYYENFFKLDGTVGFDLYKLRPAVEVGLYTDLLFDQGTWFQDYSLGFEYNPPDDSLFNLSLGFRIGTNQNQQILSRFAWGVSSFFKIFKLGLDLDFKNNFNILENAVESLDFNFSLGASYPFPDHSRLSGALGLNLASSADLWSTQFRASVEYHQPFSIPVVRKKNIGSIKGSLLNEVTGLPEEGLILRLRGLSAVTDADGAFSFPALEPGIYYLNLQRIGLKQGFIPSVPMPLKVEVKTGEETEVQIGITEGAAVTGRVNLYKSKNEGSFFVTGDTVGETPADESYDTEGFSGMILELSRGSVVKRRMSDRLGRFDFREITPGAWTLKIYSHNIPEYHKLEKESFTFFLETGQTKEIEVKIMPVRRTIRILDEGDLMLLE